MTERGLSSPVRTVDVLRVEPTARVVRADRVAVERGLEVRLHGESFAVVMRTPGADDHLTAGFLYAERVLTANADLATLTVDEASDVVDVHLSPARRPALADLLAGRRNVTTNASCGMCGRPNLAALDVPVDSLPVTWAVGADLIASLPGRLREAQAAFSETGGLHAAGLFTLDGALVWSAEDVGRHNAIDKLVGRALRADRLPLTDHILVVSGRLSFEIVQKAVLAGLAMVVAVSAPSSMAIDLATAAGITLIGFTRPPRFNVYAGAARVT